MYCPPEDQTWPDLHPVISPEAYISRDYLRREKERLWSQVWQVACREEEIPDVGDYLTYDIADNSIIVVRTAPDVIRAFHNVCRHRGRRLTSGCGKAKGFFCRFHGWRWDLEGANTQVVDREDWAGTLSEDDVRLHAVHVDTWGGYVFVNMSEAPEALRDFLGPVVEMLDPFEIQQMRFRWRKWTIVNCNWKVALEAFNEGYHVNATHPQLLTWLDDYTASFAYGKHGSFGYQPSKPFGTGSRRLGRDVADTRQAVADYYQEMLTTLDATITRTIVDAAQRIPDEVPEGASPEEALGAVFQFAREADARRGVAWPEIAVDHLIAAGIDWHVFPNSIILQAPTNVLGYRARPNGDDPDSCIFEAYTLERFPPGGEPRPDNTFCADLADEAFWGKILLQDFQNMAEVQRGMKSTAFRGAQPNPRQEIPVLNFHAALSEYLNREA